MPRPLRFIWRELERVRNVRDYSRAPRHHRSWPTASVWGVVLAAMAVALVALGYYAAKQTPEDNEFWDSLRRTLVKPSVALPAAFVILTLAAYACRRLRLEWLAWRPGRIQVQELDVSGASSPMSSTQLTNAFRGRLAGMRLAPSTAAPSAPTESDFLDVLGSGGVNASNILGTLLSLLRAAVPSFTYEIHGAVVERPGPPRTYRVSLQVARLPNQGSVEVKIDDADLDQAIRRAADHATAAILPRTRLCKGPWIAWRRYVMPGDLFNAYESACQHEEERRYDLAYDKYYRALEEDPLNMMLRLQLGQLQEKLELSLDALATYTAMEFVASPHDIGTPAGLYPRRAERARRRALVLARYRRAVLLAEGSFIKDWSDSAGEDKFSALRRRALRDQLRPWLTSQLVALKEQAPLARLLEEAEAKPLDAADWRTLQRGLSKCATSEIKSLRKTLPLVGLFFRRPPVTRRALVLTQRCIKERRKVTSPTDPPSSAKALTESVTKIERPYPRLRPQRLRRWSEHYNAACLFAIALLDKRHGEEEKERLARCSINRLERAAASADSSFVARQRAWMTSEDPDLDALREQSSFKAFEAQYFPADSPNARRPREEKSLLEMRCTRDLLIATARGWEDVWRARAAVARAQDEGPGPGEQWWASEHEAWRHVYSVAQRRDWRARLELVEAARRWRAAYGIDRIEPVFARYEVETLQVDDDEKVDMAAATEIATTRMRLDIVAGAVTVPGGTQGTFRGFTWGVRLLQGSDAEPSTLTAKARAKLCSHQANVWRGVHRWLELADGLPAEDHKQVFEQELRQAKALWVRADRAMHARRWLHGELRR
jgi:hypothetical protein